MCGIIGYVGPRNGTAEVLRGLQQLEYRGYDSAGIATVGARGRLTVTRALGRVHALRGKLDAEASSPRAAIGHTRWATHGGPELRNAHPHVDCHGQIAVVHNGIIENAQALRAELAARGHALASDTDSECIAHLIEEHLQGDLPAAVRAAAARLEGSFALVVIARDSDCIVAVRQGSPVLVGVGDEEFTVASDLLPILERTRDVLHLENRQMAVIRNGAVELYDAKGRALAAEPVTVDLSAEQTSRGGFDTYLRKEIDEQSDAVARCIRGRARPTTDGVYIPALRRFLTGLGPLSRVVFAACGTSYHASLTAKAAIESMCGVPVDVRLASELRGDSTMLGQNDLLVAVSQSGETADTLGCVEFARSRGVPVLAVCNVDGSSLVRAADQTVLTHAGPEVSVASTKAFATQVVALRMVAAVLAQSLGTAEDEVMTTLAKELLALPHLLKEVLTREAEISSAAKAHSDAKLFAFLGRKHGHAIALEGALKLAELTYVPALGFAAGELKHGPLAMVDENVSVLCVLDDGPTRAKMKSTIQEVRARGGRVLVFDTGRDDLGVDVDRIQLPSTHSLESSALVAAVALQLFAYHAALTLDRDIDRPRNLAKSVTVE